MILFRGDEELTAECLNILNIVAESEGKLELTNALRTNFCKGEHVMR